VIAALRSLVSRLGAGRSRSAASFEHALEEALDRDPVSLCVASLERLLESEVRPQGADPLARANGSMHSAGIGGSNGGRNDAPL
jgi:hypothetical protein